MLHQYIRQQADELAAAWARGYYPSPAVPTVSRGEPPIQVPQPKDDTWTPGKTPQREGKPSVTGQRNESQGPENMPSKGWREQFGLPSGGGSGPPPGGGGGGPPDNEGDNEGEAEEEEGDETDEDTISITDSSAPSEPGGGEGTGGPPGGGGPPEDPDNFPEGGVGPPRRGP